MGLDMYLYAERYISEYSDKEMQSEIESIVKMPGKVNYVTSEALYWRKANAIHNWFVKNVQDGEDDCKKYYVPFKKLIELRDTLKEILENKDKVEELLPTIHGFFFGTYNYDEYYFNEIARTEMELTKLIDDLLKNHLYESYYSFYYQSSW
jgi:hypothetical protein